MRLKRNKKQWAEPDPTLGTGSVAMATRAEEALTRTSTASHEMSLAVAQAQEIFGAIRREIALTSARKDHP